MKIATTTELIEDLRLGRMVVLVDAEDRENEGDLVMAADFVTAESINFMARHARGLICLTLEEVRCRQLNLPLMVADNRALHGTAFTASIESATGVTAAYQLPTVNGPSRWQLLQTRSRTTSCSQAIFSR